MAKTGIPTIPHRFTEDDLLPPIRVEWGQNVTGFTSELAIDRPEPNASITVTGTIIDATEGIFEYPWSAGDLVAGEGQRVKARLFNGSGDRESTEYFLIDVEEDIS